MDQMTNPLDKLHGYYFEDLEEGMHDVFAKTITDADIVLFAGISGDTNPIHLNHERKRQCLKVGSHTACCHQVSFQPLLAPSCLDQVASM